MTTGYLPWELWRTLWRFWPVLIIIAGLNILLRNLSPWLLSLLILLVLTGCIVIAAYQSGYPLNRETISIPRDTAMISMFAEDIGIQAS